LKSAKVARNLLKVKEALFSKLLADGEEEP
jgi:hypothetical protein